MPRHQPAKSEKTKGDIANGAEVQVVEDFSQLGTTVNKGAIKISEHHPTCTYREKDIGKIHTTQNSVTDTREIDAVTGCNQDDGDDVVGKHGVVILATLFDIKHIDLLNPEA